MSESNPPLNRQTRGRVANLEKGSRIMSSGSKFMLASLIAITAFAIAAAGTQARNLSSSSQTFRVVWNPLTFDEGSLAIRCIVTIEGSFHSRTILKRIDTLMGYITAATVRHQCTEPLNFFTADAWAYNGTEVALGITLANSLPWHITYKGFTGALPNIGRLLLAFKGVRFALRITGLSCLGNYKGESVIVEANLLSAGRIASLTPEASARLELVGESENCPLTQFLVGAGAVTVLNTATALTITLI